MSDIIIKICIILSIVFAFLLINKFLNMQLTQIMNMIVNIINCIIFILIYLFYSISNGYGILIPLFGSGIVLFTMIMSYIRCSKILYAIYLLLSAFFYLIVSAYVIFYNVVTLNISNNIIYLLLFKMNIPTLIVCIAIIFNAYEIENGIVLKIDMSKKST